MEKRRKAKVGKRKPQPLSHTDTSFKTRRITLPSQNIVDKPTAAALLASTAHYNERVRRDALLGLVEQPPRPGPLTERVFPLIADADGDVRKAALQVLEAALPLASAAQVLPFARIMVVYVASALTALGTSVRLDALEAVDSLVRHCPAAMRAHGAQLLDALADMLAWRQSSRTGHAQRQGSHVLAMGKLREKEAAAAAAGKDGAAASRAVQRRLRVLATLHRLAELTTSCQEEAEEQKADEPMPDAAPLGVFGLAPPAAEDAALVPPPMAECLRKLASPAVAPESTTTTNSTTHHPWAQKTAEQLHELWVECVEDVGLLRPISGSMALLLRRRLLAAPAERQLQHAVRGAFPLRGGAGADAVNDTLCPLVGGPSAVRYLEGALQPQPSQPSQSRERTARLLRIWLQQLRATTDPGLRGRLLAALAERFRAQPTPAALPALRALLAAGDAGDAAVVADLAEALPRMLWELGAAQPAASADALRVLHSLARRGLPVPFARLAPFLCGTSRASGDKVYGGFVALPPADQLRALAVLHFAPALGARTLDALADVALWPALDAEVRAAVFELVLLRAGPGAGLDAFVLRAAAAPGGLALALARQAGLSAEALSEAVDNNDNPGREVVLLAQAQPVPGAARAAASLVLGGDVEVGVAVGEAMPAEFLAALAGTVSSGSTSAAGDAVLQLMQSKSPEWLREHGPQLRAVAEGTGHAGLGAAVRVLSS